MLLAKESLMEPIDIHDLQERGPSNHSEALRLELFEKVNALGIGAQGLGGLTTVVDVKILDYPTHAASLPVGMIPNCAATRHVEFHLDGRAIGTLTMEPFVLHVDLGEDLDAALGGAKSAPPPSRPWLRARRQWSSRLWSSLTIMPPSPQVMILLYWRLKQPMSPIVPSRRPW